MIENIVLQGAIYIILTMVLTIIIGKIGLPILTKIKVGQFIREEGPASHVAKMGTPTMGGWFFLIAITIVTLTSNLFLGGTPASIWFYLVTLLMYAAIGFIDDYLKVIKKQNLGLTSLKKLGLQVFMVILLFIIFPERFSDWTLHFLTFEVHVPITAYLLFAIIWFSGFSNATNVTDGVDGLLGSTALIAFLALAVIAVIQQSYGTAVFCFITIGALLGFLFFNRYPAKVFMGDTGSLALGALLAAVSIELHIEILLLIIGSVFVFETLSVIIQVSYFKYSKRKFGEGRRIFLMSPYHHHLELKGWTEKQIVLIFSIVGLLSAILSIMLVILT
ncbi:phospho-N-acetylmuramoyl-pentapeptide-transferase [Erysipelotrichaceae bacterium]|nr:phospho-N-acetylmuramoyl-pentapeptide-transferase [Erysipelotrichaceae bacterium]